MEEDMFQSPVGAPKQSELVKKRLKEAVDIAQERLDYESAHNEDLLQALHVVAEFIKKKKRVCYGGTAMNEILPDSKKFYNPELDLPDYDFYTPALEEDVAELVADLRAAGFKDVYNKVGIHEGTKKILVNFVAVADISRIEPDLFKVFYERSILRNGMHYTDPNTLRMMMYLELSRPRGDVSRWEKVFERLQLINKIFPVQGAGCGGAATEGDAISTPARYTILDFVIEQQRILCNGPIETLYTRGIRHGDARFQYRAGGPIVFTSPDPRGDAKLLKKALKGENAKLYLHKARGELVPERVELRNGGDRPLCMIISEVACHAFNPIPLEDGRSIRIGGLEFLITLYLSLEIFTTRAADFLGSGVLCRVKSFIRLAEQNYTAKKSQFPAFALNCSGHQVGFISLLRRKVLRIKKEREAMEGRAGSRRRKATKRSKTKKRS